MDFAKALSQARQHSSIVQRMEFALRSEPANRKMALGLGSARRRANSSQAALERFAAKSQIDLVRYRLLHGDDLYAVEAVADSVQAFQHSFTGAADFLKNGAKDKGRYSKEIENRTRLNLAYTFAGSLGLVLAVENKRDLFEFGELDQVIDIFGQFLAVSDADAAIEASRKLGAALITRLCEWVDANTKWDNSVDFVVQRATGSFRGEHITKNQFYDLHDIFHSAKDEEPYSFTLTGILVGLDNQDRRFHFVVPDGDDYKGSLASDYPTVPTVVGNRYQATIQETVSRVVATGKETRTYKLSQLNGLSV